MLEQSQCHLMKYKHQWPVILLYKKNNNKYRPLSYIWLSTQENFLTYQLLTDILRHVVADQSKNNLFMKERMGFEVAYKWEKVFTLAYKQFPVYEQLGSELVPREWSRLTENSERKAFASQTKYNIGHFPPERKHVPSLHFSTQWYLELMGD